MTQAIGSFSKSKIKPVTELFPELFQEIGLVEEEQQDDRDLST